MDRTTNIPKGTFMRLASHLTPEQLNNIRSLSPRFKDWGFEYMVRNNLLDMEKIKRCSESNSSESESAWSLILESKLDFFQLHSKRGLENPSGR